MGSLDEAEGWRAKADGGEDVLGYTEESTNEDKGGKSGKERHRAVAVQPGPRPWIVQYRDRRRYRQIHLVRN